MTASALAPIVATRRILFVGGKGGVGKTTTASAIALAAAQRGRRVLIVSTDPAHNLGHVWERRVGARPVPLVTDAPDAPGGPRPSRAPFGRLDGIEIDPDATAREHLARVGDTLRALMPEHLAGQVDRLLRLSADAPGAHEAALLERIAELAACSSGPEAPYDLVVFDTAPSGHTARLMSLPESMSAWTEALLDNRRRADGFADAHAALGGATTRGARRDDRNHRIRRILLERREKLANLRDALRDPDRTAFIAVLAAERLPVLETIELRAQLADAGVRVAALVVNRRSPADAGELLALRHTSERAWLDRLREAVPEAPVTEVPLFAQEPVGAAALARVGALLLGAAPGAPPA